MCLYCLGSISFVVIVFAFIYQILTRQGTNECKMITNLSLSDLISGIYLAVIASTDVFYRGKFCIYAYAWQESVLCKIEAVLSNVSYLAPLMWINVLTIYRYLKITSYNRHPLLSVKFYYIAPIVWGSVIATSILPVILVWGWTG